jgi:glucosamine 6-phosphate synthetase-like amidotransferase/phosphosugar isomerase protein
MHARATTDGDPNRNINNHPHIGEHSVLVHNGMIWQHENIARSHNLKLKSDCDSEVLLRLAEQKESMTEGVEHMAKVIKQAPSTGSWAVAIVDRRNPSEVVVARNVSPLVLYKCPRLKMTFFASTEDIFEKACSILYKEKNPHKLGFEKMAVDVHRIYRLRSDGTVVADKAMTIEDTTYSQHHQHSQGHQSTDASFRRQPRHAYLYSDIFGFDVEIDPLGNIRGFADAEEHKDAQEDIVIERVKQEQDEGLLPTVETALAKEEIQELIDFIKAI